MRFSSLTAVSILASLQVISISASAAPAAATAACADGGRTVIVGALHARSSQAGIPLAPAAQFEGLNNAELQADTYAARVSKLQNSWADSFAKANALFMANSDSATISKAVFGGDGTIRSDIASIGRPAGDPAATASRTADCKKGKCQQAGASIKQIYFIKGSSIEKAAEGLSIFKLRSELLGEVHYCQIGPNCNMQTPFNQMTKDTKPAPMKLDAAYILHEEDGLLPKLNTTAVFAVTSLNICGEDALLMTGNLVKNAPGGSLSEMSQVALFTQRPDGVLVQVMYQSRAETVTDTVKAFFISPPSDPKALMASDYGKQGALMGSIEAIGSNGRIK